VDIVDKADTVVCRGDAVVTDCIAVYNVHLCCT